MSRTGGVDMWLRRFVKAHAGVGGAVHLRNGRDELALVAAVGSEGLDDDDWRAPRRLSKGQGPAGIAFERNAAIFTRPRAETPVPEALHARPRRPPRRAPPRAVVAVPVHDHNGEVRAVVEIEFPAEKPVDDAELMALDHDAGSLPEA